LIDQFVANESTDNLLYYAMRFVDGLRDDLKQMVMIQHPSKLDIACALALVQEEAVDSTKRKEGRCFESSFHRSTLKPTFSLPTPLIDKHQGSQSVEDHRSVDTH
jgi:hypothetical protein